MLAADARPAGRRATPRRRGSGPHRGAGRSRWCGAAGGGQRDGAQAAGGWPAPSPARRPRRGRPRRTPAPRRARRPRPRRSARSRPAGTPRARRRAGCSRAGTSPAAGPAGRRSASARAAACPRPPPRPASSRRIGAASSAGSMPVRRQHDQRQVELAVRRARDQLLRAALGHPQLDPGVGVVERGAAPAAPARCTGSAWRPAAPGRGCSPTRSRTSRRAVSASARIRWASGSSVSPAGVSSTSAAAG